MRRCPPFPLRVAPAAACVFLLPLACGCGQDPRSSPPSPELTVRVEAEGTGLPVPGVKVLLMDAATNRPLAGPVASDASGLCRLAVAGGGRPRLVVFGGPGWSVHVQPDWYDVLRAADGTPAAGNPAVAPDAPAVENRLIMRPRVRPGGPPFFSGTVVDAVTGLPLDRAFVSLSPWPTGYGAGTGASDDVTGADGAFKVYDIPIAIDRDTGIGFQVLPLLVSREGYRTRRWSYDPPGGLDYTEILGVVIALTPQGDADAGRLTGRVERGGAPVADLLVGLGLAPGDKGAVGVAGQVARTAADGRFRFDHLPAGAYVAYPGFLVGDGAWFGGGPPAIEVAADSTADLGVLTVLHEITPGGGNRDRLAAADTTVSFAWTAVPGAVRYGWFLDGELRAESGAAGVTVELPPLESGLHRWQVTALDDGGAVVGVMQNDAWFRQDPP